VPIDLAGHIRDALADRADIREIRMFGGLCFMLGDHMLAGVTSSGGLLARVGPDGMEAALGRPGARRMEMGGRVMKGYVIVEAARLDDAALAEWLRISSDFVQTLPPKKK
jgi:hypothetical protein